MDRYAYFLVSKQTLDEGTDDERERYVVNLPTGSKELLPGMVTVIKTNIGGKDGIMVRLSKQAHMRVAPFAAEFIAWQHDVADRVAVGAIPLSYYRALFNLMVEDLDTPEPYDYKLVTVQEYEAMDPKPKIFRAQRKAAE